MRLSILASLFVSSLAFAQGYSSQDAPYTDPPPSDNASYQPVSPVQSEQNDSSESGVTYVEAPQPLDEPEAFGIEWAPPPLLWEDVPYAPFDDAIWVGGYWTWWGGGWAWARGRWMGSPRPGYAWNPPYYESRGGRVVFVGGYWRQPGTKFRVPSTMPKTAFVAPNVSHGPRVIGTTGVFVPAPPGSRPGLVVAAPLGTSPRVVASQPAMDKPGMRVSGSGAKLRVQAPTGTTRGGQRVDARVAAVAPHGGERQSSPMQTRSARTMQPQHGSQARAPIQGERALPQRPAPDTRPMTAPPQAAPVRTESVRPEAAPRESAPRAAPAEEPHMSAPAMHGGGGGGGHHR